MNKKPENLFDDFRPLKRNEKAYRQLKRKLNNKATHTFFMNRPVKNFGAAIIVLFVFIGTVTFFMSDSNFSPLTSTGDAIHDQAEVTERNYVFSAESEHWKAEVISNSIQIMSEENNTIQLENSGQSTFKLTFKGENAQTISDFSYRIESAGSTSAMSGGNPFDNGNTYTTSLSNDVLYKKETLKLKVTWDGKQESLTLKFDDPASEETKYKRARDLSHVTMKTYEESFSKWDTNGVAGDDGFQISTVSWDERMIPFDHFEPSLLASGHSLTQSVILTFSDQELFPYKLRIKAKHAGGHEMMIWKGDVSTKYVKQYNNRLAVPAFLTFGKEGHWDLTAYYEDKKLGTVAIDVREQNDPLKYNIPLQDGKLWTPRFGMLSYFEKSAEIPDTSVLITGKNHVQKVAWLFRNISDSPVIIIGQHESGKEYFFSTFDSLMAGIHGADFHQIDSPRFPKEGTWNVKGFANGEYLGGITFLVKHTE